jgi:hypothetical protein
MLAALSIPTGVRAQSADSVAVLDAVQRLFTAMAQRDTVAARRLLIPGSRFISVRTATVDAPMRSQGDTTFLRALANEHDQLLERLWAPVVRISGPVAMVWAPYDFHVNARRTHCGVDAFTLIRGSAGWQIAGIAYTVETTGCPASPLGPVQ